MWLSLQDEGLKKIIRAFFFYKKNRIDSHCEVTSNSNVHRPAFKSMVIYLYQIFSDLFDLYYLFTVVYDVVMDATV